MASVAVLGAAGYAGAIAAQLLYRHPFFELSRTSPRGRRPGSGWTTCTRARACRWSSRCSTGPARRRRGGRRLPARRGGAGRGRAARPRRARRRPLRRLPAARPRHLRGLVRRARARRSYFGQGVYGLPELTREEVRGADLVANPGCYPTAALLGLAPLARAGLIGDVVIDAKSGVSGAGRGADARRRTSSPPTRTSRPTRSRATGTRRRSSRSSRRSAQRRDDHVHAAPAAARPGRARLLLRHAVARAGRGRAASSSSTTRTRASRSSSCATGRSA